MSYNSAYIKLLRSLLYDLLYSQSVSEPACRAGWWTTTLGGTVTCTALSYVL